MNRIKRDIAPYFATDERRFSGSLVVAARNPDDIRFETMGDVARSGALPFAYGKTTGDLGFISFEDQRLVTLDGQHRAKAFQMALEKRNDPKTRDGGRPPRSWLGNDKVAVILVRFDASLSRYIFNKINKYAKPTSKAGKIITDDDDSMAIITRKLMTSGAFSERLVNMDASSLNKSAPEFTLLSTFHDANKALLLGLPRRDL